MSDQNKIFFSMVRHVFEEHAQVDWAFKTSLVFVKGFNANLEQSAIDSADQLENILTYLREAKPYHTNFSGLTEQQSAAQETANLQIFESVTPKITLHFDRMSCTPDLPGFDTAPYDYDLGSSGSEVGFDAFDLAKADLNNAANRITAFYEPGSGEQEKELASLMECDFKGFLVSGGEIDIDEILFDTDFFERFGFDVPVIEAFYEVTAAVLPSTEYATITDAVSETTDYGLITEAVIDTLDWGTLDEPVPAPASAVTFPLPFVPFETKKVLVYYDQPDGSRALTTDTYEIVGLNVVFDQPPPVGVVVYLAVIDYDYLYDKIYSPGSDWAPGAGDENVRFFGEGMLRPHWDRNHPQELSPIRALENLDIRVFTNQGQVLGTDPGYDENGYDTIGYDLGESDLAFATGGGPEAVTESFYGFEISDTYELAIRPQSTEAIFVFENGLILDPGSGYTVDWTEPEYSDTNRDDHITNPRVNLLSSPSDSDKVSFVSYGFGGAIIQTRFVEYDTNLSSHDVGVVITDPALVFATVNGTVAETIVDGSVVTVTSPIVPAGATVAITVFSDIDFVKVRTQRETTDVMTLSNPPGSSQPGYQGIKVWNEGTGLRLNHPETKIYLAKPGEDTYASASGTTGTFDVFLDGSLQTDGVDYSVSGTDIIFNAVPPLGTEIIIQKPGTGEFTLSTATVDNDTLTVSASVALRAVTFNDDLSLGLRTESHAGNIDLEYDVGGIPSNETQLWVYLDGVLQYQGIDFVYEVDELAETRKVRFLAAADHSSSRIQVTYPTENIAARPVAYRMTYGPQGEIDFLRISDRHTTELVSEYRSGIDTVIEVRDAAVLGQPSPLTIRAQDRIPGRIWLGTELIEFWAIDYTTSPHQLKNLRPGRDATGMGLVHPVGTKVIDASRKQKMPKKIEIERKSRIAYRTQFAGTRRHSILGDVRDPSKVQVWVQEATELINDFLPDDSEIVVRESGVFTLPGDTILSNTNPVTAGDMNIGDRLRVQLNGQGYLFVTLAGTDAAAVKSAFDNNASLVAKGLSVSVNVDDTITFTHSGGGSLIIENLSGYALQDLFGGQITGTVSNPVVTVDGSAGITVNGVDVVFTGATLSRVITDINDAAIENIIAREKANRIQIVNLVGESITVANLNGSGLTELGISSVTASSILRTNGNQLQAVGSRSSTKGALWIDQEKIEFGFYDPSVSGEHILGDLSRSLVGIDPEIVYSAGKTIIGSKQELKVQGVDYSVIGRQIKFTESRVPSTGSFIRIQNEPDIGRIVIPDFVQTAQGSVSRFLRKAPGNSD